MTEPMPSIDAISSFNRVEFVDPVDDAPAGARGGVLELTDATTAMVEVTSPELEAAARIVFAPLASLRRVA